MKLKIITPFIATILLCAGCGNNKAATAETQPAGNISAETATQPSTAAVASGDGIVGTWRMYLDAFDDNSNQVLDEEERKKAIKNNYVLQLNADGTCKIQGMFNGSYTVKEEGGKKMLNVQRKKIQGEEDEDPLPDIYHIKSLKKDEMILLLTEGGRTTTFWIFKRDK